MQRCLENVTQVAHAQRLYPWTFLPASTGRPVDWCHPSSAPPYLSPIGISASQPNATEPMAGPPFWTETQTSQPASIPTSTSVYTSFGPTFASMDEGQAPDVLEDLLTADKASIERLGHEMPLLKHAITVSCPWPMQGQADRVPMGPRRL